MPSFQHVQILGHVGQGPKTFATKEGKSIAKWSVAVDEGSKDKERTEWFNCVAFGVTADIVSERFSKGDLVMVEGSIRTEKYTDKKTNQEKTLHSLIAGRVYWLRSANGTGKPQSRATETKKPAEKYNYGPPPMSDDDIPF